MPGDVVFLVGRAGLARAGLLALEAALEAALASTGRETPAGNRAAGETADKAGRNIADRVRARYPEAVAAHLRPLPRLAEGTRLSALAAALERERGESVRLGLMDLSDGLARDLPRLLGPGKGAAIRLPKPHPEIVRFLLETDGSRAGAEFVESGQSGGMAATVTSGATERMAGSTAEDEAARVTRHAWLGGEEYGLIGFCEPRFAAQVMVNAAEAVFLGHVTEDGRFLCDGLDCGRDFGPGFDHFS